MPDYKRLIRKNIPPRRSQGKNPSPKFLSKAILSLILCLLIVAGLCWGYAWLTHFPEFKIKEVYVINEKGKPLPNPQDFFRLNLTSGLNLFTFKMEKIVQDIQARHPELADVFIRKQFPHTLLIIVKERQPVALILSRNLCLADAEGFILPFKPEYKELPKIVGVAPNHIQLYTKSHSLNLKAALKLLAQLRKAKIYPAYKVSRIDVTRAEDLVFYFENGTEVRMGQDDFTHKIALLKGILTQLKKEKTVPQYIDMRFGNPTVLP